MTYKIIHTLAFDRQFAQHKPPRERIILLENQLRENPHLGIQLEAGIHRIRLNHYVLFYSINEELHAVIMLEIRDRKKDNTIPQEPQRPRSSQFRI